MTVGSLVRVLLLLASLGLVQSCGDDDEQASYESSCDAACERAHSCNSDVDVAACASDCKSDAADVGPRLSSAFLGELDACIAEANCVQLAAMPAAQACQREAAAQLAPSAAARELCDAVVASLQMCLGLTVGPAGCLETVKIFSDSALSAARACDKMSCDQRSACMSRELGADPSAMQ
jgi:hypothetical protein